MNATTRIRARPVAPVEATPIPVRARHRPAPQPVEIEVEAPSPASQEIRQRVRGKGEPPIPRQWSNGSGVFREGSAGRKPKWVVPDEENPGFLGRIERLDDGRHHVWRWNAVKKSYVFMGTTRDHLSAIGFFT